MGMFSILNQNNEKLMVHVIRYYKMENKLYFIFTLNEADADGHIKIYISKIMNMNGIFVGNKITDDVEWEGVKESIRQIIKNTRDNVPLSIEDLEVKQIEGIKILGENAFRLASNMVEILKKVVDSNEGTSQVVNPTNVPLDSDVSMVSSVETNIPSVNLDTSVSSFEPNMVDKQGTMEPVSSAIPETTIPSNTAIADHNVSEYKSLYFQVLEQNKKLIEEIEHYRTKLENVKAILN